VAKNGLGTRLVTYGVRFASKRIFQQGCSKKHVFTKYQWNNDGFYSSKTAIFGEYRYSAARRTFRKRKHRLDVRWLANIDYTVYGWCLANIHNADRCL